jgi:methyl-accepting chemotaxis protein
MKKINLLAVIAIITGIIFLFLPLNIYLEFFIFLILGFIIYLNIRRTFLSIIIKDNSLIEIKDERVNLNNEDLITGIEPEKNNVIFDFSEVYNKSDQLTKNISEVLYVIDNDDFSRISKDFAPVLDEASTSSYAIKGSVEQIYTISDNLAKTTQTAFDLSKSVHNSIHYVSQTLDKAVSVTKELDLKSMEISKILDIMSNISSMVHVLSINASIVSARAGIHGEGFKVVAKEIRNLAISTDKSLSDIDAKVKDVQEAVSNVTTEIQEANRAIDEEAHELTNVAGALQGVLLSVEIINTVSSATKDTTEDQFKTINSLKKSTEILLNSVETRKAKEKLAINKVLDSFNECIGCIDKLKNK